MSQPILLSPGDILRRKDAFWEVTGVYLGALGQENLVGVKCLTKKLQSEREIFMPEDFIYTADIYHAYGKRNVHLSNTEDR